VPCEAKRPSFGSPTRQPAGHSPMDQAQLSLIADFICNIADDVLRDVYVRGKYRDVILPMTVLRRCVFAPARPHTRVAVTSRYSARISVRPSLLVSGTPASLYSRQRLSKSAAYAACPAASSFENATRVGPNNREKAAPPPAARTDSRTSSGAEPPGPATPARRSAGEPRPHRPTAPERGGAGRAGWNGNNRQECRCYGKNGCAT